MGAGARHCSRFSAFPTARPLPVGRFRGHREGADGRSVFRPSPPKAAHSPWHCRAIAAGSLTGSGDCLSAPTGSCVICLPLNFRRHCNLNLVAAGALEGVAGGGACIAQTKVTGIPERDRQRQTEENSVLGCVLGGAGPRAQPQVSLGILKGVTGDPEE